MTAGQRSDDTFEENVHEADQGKDDFRAVDGVINTEDETSKSEGAFNDLFRELLHSYTRRCQKWDNFRNKYVDAEEERIEMHKPVECFHYKTNNIGEPVEKVPLERDRMVNDLYSEVELKSSLRRFPEDMDVGDRFGIPVEYCGITLKQLRGVWALIKRRCVEECWKDRDGTRLTLDSITSHDVNTYVVEPFTKKHKKSFVETLPSTGGYQRPRIMASARFNMPFKDLMACIETFVHDFRTNATFEHEKKGGGMTENTPIWLWLFAKKWDKDYTYPDDPVKTPFAKAMRKAQYRVLSISDNKGRYFQRIWCLFETITALKHGMWYIYTPYIHGHAKQTSDAVGLIPGGATSDILAMDTLNREKYFTTELIVSCTKLSVEKATAEKPTDRSNVLNWIINGASLPRMDELDDTDLCTDSKEEDVSKYSLFPRRKKKKKKVNERCQTFTYGNANDAPEHHPEYDIVNASFRSRFVTTGTLQAALSDSSWKKMIDIMSKGDMKEVRFDFEKGNGWDKLKEEDAIKLINSLPHTIIHMEISCSSFSSKFIEALSAKIENSQLQRLHLENTLVNNNVDHKTIMLFADALSLAKDLKDLQIWRVSKGEESKVLEEDLKVLQILSQRGNVADALFYPIENFYLDDKPSFYKITFLHILFMRLNIPFLTLSQEKIRLSLDWATSLERSQWNTLFQSEAGSFFKIASDYAFTRKRNLTIVLLDLYSQIATVVILCILNENTNDDCQCSVYKVILICCFGWKLLREVVQISTSYLQYYIKDVKNILDLTQITLLFMIITFLEKEDEHDRILDLSVYGMCVSWISLIFELSNIWFPLATFVSATIQILWELVPFLFTATMIILMFAHAFRVSYNEERCNPDAPLLDGWKQECSTVFESYMKAYTMFLTDADWNFDDKQGVMWMFLYAFIMGILLLNMVIAVVSNKFTKVQDRAKMVFYEHRNRVLTENRTFWPFLFKFIFHPVQLLCFSRYEHKHPLLLNYLRCQLENIFSFHERVRFSFLCKTSYDEVAHIENMKDDARITELRDVVEWWFSPNDWDICPSISTRLKVFYMYSLWDDIIFPGEVFERIVVGLKYHKEFKNDKKINDIKLCYCHLLAKMLAIILCPLHILILIVIFISGLLSLGISWPMPMKQFLFHESNMPEMSETKDLRKDIDKLQDFITHTIRKQLKENNEAKENEV